MQKLIKYISYFVIFAVSFLIFLYWSFPYDSLKDRLISGVERQMGGIIVIEAGDLEPYWFTGVEIEKLSLSVPDGKGNMLPAISMDKLRIRAALFSLLIGRPRISYYIKSGSGEVSGKARQIEDGIDFSADFDEFNISAIKYLKNKYGINISGEIDGSVSMTLSYSRPARSTGSISVDLADFKIAASQAILGPMELPLPDMVLTKARGSSIKMDISKGSLNVDKLILAEGDLGLDVSGKVFLSNTISNSRFNLKGSFSASEVLGKALPFLFIIEKQKQEDGTYPINITGRISAPSIKVGNFTLPL